MYILHISYIGNSSYFESIVPLTNVESTVKVLYTSYSLLFHKPSFTCTQGLIFERLFDVLVTRSERTIVVEFNLTEITMDGQKLKEFNNGMEKCQLI